MILLGLADDFLWGKKLGGSDWLSLACHRSRTAVAPLERLKILLQVSCGKLSNFWCTITYRYWCSNVGVSRRMLNRSIADILYKLFGCSLTLESVFLFFWLVFPDFMTILCCGRIICKAIASLRLLFSQCCVFFIVWSGSKSTQH